jgi:hypothetical protein
MADNSDIDSAGGGWHRVTTAQSIRPRRLKSILGLHQVVPSSDGCMIFRCRGSVALLLQNGTTVVRGRRRWSVSATTTVSKATPPETPIPSSAANGLSYGGFCPSCGRQHFLPCTPEVSAVLFPPRRPGPHCHLYRFILLRRAYTKFTLDIVSQ